MSDKPKRQVEETKDSRPKTAGTRGGRGPRNQDGPSQTQYKPHPETAGAKGRKDEGQTQKPEEDSKRDNRPRDKPQNKRNDQDVNSWKYKFHNREQKKYPKVVFTADTEIPALPPKESRLKQPSKEDFDAQMQQIDDKINEIREKKKQLQHQRTEIQQGGKMSGSQLTYKEAMNAKITENKKTKSEQSKLLESIRNINTQLESIEEQKRDLLKGMHKNYHNVDQVESEIADLEHRQKTYSHKSASDEAKLIREIEQLKASLPKAKQFSTLKPKADKLYAEKKVLLEQVKGYRARLDEQNAEIEKLRKEMETIKEN